MIFFKWEKLKRETGGEKGGGSVRRHKESHQGLNTIFQGSPQAELGSPVVVYISSLKITALKFCSLCGSPPTTSTYRTANYIMAFDFLDAKIN